MITQLQQWKAFHIYEENFPQKNPVSTANSLLVLSILT